MTIFYDDLETRSVDQREADQLAALNGQLARIAGHGGTLVSDADKLLDLSGLAALPVLRKSDLAKWQSEKPPLFFNLPVRFMNRVALPTIGGAWVVSCMLRDLAKTILCRTVLGIT